MPTQTYNNPFAGLPEPNVPYNAFASGINQTERSNTMAPFMDMEKQRQQLDLQKHTQTTQEFMSPQAKQSRMSGFEAVAAKAGFDTAKAKSDLATLPQEEQVKVAELRNTLIAAQNQPTTKFMQAAGLISSQLEKAPPEAQQRAWASFRTRLNMEGIPTPQGFEQWSPEVMAQIKQVGYASVMTPDHIQKLEQERAKQEGTLANTKEHNVGTERVANINAGSAKYTADQRAQTEKPRNIGQEKVRLLQVLSSPTATQEEKDVAAETLKGYVSDTYVKLLTANSLQLLKKEVTREELLEEAHQLEGVPKKKQGEPVKQEARNQALQLFGSYEPDKYEYGINPSTGKFARRAKGK